MGQFTESMPSRLTPRRMKGITVVFRLKLAASPIDARAPPTFMVLAIVATSILVSQRLQDLEAKAQLEAMISREAAFLYNNLVLVGIAFSVLWGTLFPILSEAVRGSKITVGDP